MKEIKDPYSRRRRSASCATSRPRRGLRRDVHSGLRPDRAPDRAAIAAEDVITTGCDTKELEVVKRTTRNEQLRTVQLLRHQPVGFAGSGRRALRGRPVRTSAASRGRVLRHSERPATEEGSSTTSTARTAARPASWRPTPFDAARASSSRCVLDERRRSRATNLRAALANLSKPFAGAAGDTVFAKDREAQKPFFWLWINRGNILEFDPEGPPPVRPLRRSPTPARARKSR